MHKEEKLELLKIVASISSYSFCEGMMYPHNEHETEKVNEYWNKLYKFLEKLTNN